MMKLKLFALFLVINPIAFADMADEIVACLEKSSLRFHERRVLCSGAKSAKETLECARQADKEFGLLGMSVAVLCAETTSATATVECYRKLSLKVKGWSPEEIASVCGKPYLAFSNN